MEEEESTGRGTTFPMLIYYSFDPNPDQANELIEQSKEVKEVSEDSNRTGLQFSISIGRILSIGPHKWKSPTPLILPTIHEPYGAEIRTTKPDAFSTWTIAKED